MGFWDFKACSKRDVLKDPRHIHIIIEAIKDRQTGIQRSANGYILYGPDSALLAQDCTCTTELMFEILCPVCGGYSFI